MSYFTYQGKQVYYTECGSGTPLLFLHGNTASSHMFRDLVPVYAARYRVILIDFLGYGQSERLDALPADLWYDEAQQVIALLRQKGCRGAHLIGSSGGALCAINAALEAPELVDRVIADSFEGEFPLPSVTEYLSAQREASKHDEGARNFYRAMQGDDWERVVDCDTDAVLRHKREIGRFFRGDLSTLKAGILLTGSRQNEFMASLGPDFFEKIYGDMLQKIGHGSMHLFDGGGHPAMLTCAQAFIPLSMEFLEGQGRFSVSARE